MTMLLKQIVGIDVAQKELVHAKATIKSVLENTTDTRIKELANTRLTELNAMKTNE